MRPRIFICALWPTCRGDVSGNGGGGVCLYADSRGISRDKRLWNDVREPAGGIPLDVKSLIRRDRVLPMMQIESFHTGDSDIPKC